MTAPGTADLTAHFGDPMREQRVLATAAGVVDRSDRGVLAVTGEDRLSWLHSICSQHVSDLRDGDSAEALVLSPHGHVEQHWQVTELAHTVWLDVEPGMASDAIDYLQKMRFLKRVAPADVSADWAVVTLAGPTSARVLETAGLPDPAARAAALDGGGFVRAMPDGSIDVIAPRPAVSTLIERLVAGGAIRVGLWALEARRVAARRPRVGFETDHRTIPHEVGWIGTAVHLDKGCYRGQETVARVQNLGRPPRRLVLLHLSGERDELPPAGTPLQLDGRTVGFLGTAAHHHELGPVALAVIKRTVADGTVLDAAGIPAAVTD
ncbi:MAG: folate-binding protein [Actinomycetota bacterium]